MLVKGIIDCDLINYRKRKDEEVIKMFDEDTLEDLLDEIGQLNKKVKQLSSENASLKKQIKDLENNIDK